MVSPTRGDIWWCDPDPIRGREQGFPRPFLIISATAFNHGPYQLLIGIPLTRSQRNFPYWVEVRPEHSGMRDTGFIMCEQIRAISKARLLDSQPAGRVSPEIMALVEDRLSIVLGFPP